MWPRSDSRTADDTYRRAQNKLGNARHVFLLGARNLPFPLGARVHSWTRLTGGPNKIGNKNEGAPGDSVHGESIPNDSHLLDA